MNLFVGQGFHSLRRNYCSQSSPQKKVHLRRTFPMVSKGVFKVDMCIRSFCNYSKSQICPFNSPISSSLISKQYQYVCMQNTIYIDTFIVCSKLVGLEFRNLGQWTFTLRLPFPNKQALRQRDQRRSSPVDESTAGFPGGG